MTAVDRRDFLVSTLVAAASSALPGTVAARSFGAAAREQEIVRVAREQLARVGARIALHDVVAVADFSVDSAEPRFYLVDVTSGFVRSCFRVAHGAGSDPDNDGLLTRFSNISGSNATSRGAYVTVSAPGGASLHALGLVGLDPDNSCAVERSLVIHAADYCTADHVARWGRPGRSKGGFALAHDDFKRAAGQLSGGRLVYAGYLKLG